MGYDQLQAQLGRLQSGGKTSTIYDSESSSAQEGRPQSGDKTPTAPAEGRESGSGQMGRPQSENPRLPVDGRESEAGFSLVDLDSDEMSLERRWAALGRASIANRFSQEGSALAERQVGGRVWIRGLGKVVRPYGGTD